MPTLKAVIDTSVMVSVAFAKEGLAKELRNIIADGTIKIATSEDIMAELYRVLHYPHIIKRFKPSEDDIDEFIDMIMEQALITRGDYSIHKIKDDPTDDMFLDCALEAKADFIVSRDPHLLNLKQFYGIKIINLKIFTETVKKMKDKS